MDNWFQSITQVLQTMSPWEVAGVLLAIGYLLLAVKENVLCWLFAFVSTAIYTLLFWNVNLLMDSALNVYYMLMAVYGWYSWTHGGANGGRDHHALAVRSMSGRQHTMVISAIVVLTVVSGHLLSEHSGAAWPYVDSFTTWASVITTYLVARKFLQNWVYWIVIDAVSVPLYIERGLNLTAGLFVFYVIIAFVGYFSWREHLRNNGQIIEG